MTVHLYHWEPNANSGKPMLALAEKGVEFESHYIDLLKFDQHQPEYLKINPDGTIPAMVHGERVLTESTPMMEYADDAFDGPPLKPTDPRERWRMRWWMRFFDSYFAPSLSMIGWSVFVGPAVRQRPKEELEAAIARIPLESRRIAWRKAMFNEFSEAELTESRRRVLYCTGMLEDHLARHEWIAGTTLLARRHERLQPGICPAALAARPLQRRQDTAHHGMAAAHLRAPRREEDLVAGPHGHGPTREIPGARHPCLSSTTPNRTRSFSSR